MKNILVTLLLLSFAHGYATDLNSYFREAAKNSHEFKAFKSHPIFINEQENVSVEDGWLCLRKLQTHYPQIFRNRELLRRNDEVGNPVLHNFGPLGQMSPTTLFYAKTAAELHTRFPDLSEMHVCELGGGYGGQCLLTALIAGFKSYTLVDHPDKLALAKKYLEYHEIYNVNYIDEKAFGINLPIDLIFANKDLDYSSDFCQKLFAKKRVQGIKNGYLCVEFPPQKTMGALGEVIRTLKNSGKHGAIFMDDTQLRFTRRLIMWKEPTTIFDKKYLENPVLTNSEKESHGITFSLSGGRLGDNLTSYLHAKWVAMKKNIPLYMRDFDHSSKFAFHVLEPRIEWPRIFKKLLVVKNWEAFDQPAATLFNVPFFPETRYELETNLHQFHFHFEIDWFDKVFRSVVKKMLAPAKPLAPMKLPEDCVRIAMHVRLGGGYDPPSGYKGYPLKFPTEAYYVRQLKQVASVYKDQPLYVYIFTDDRHPPEVMKRIASQVNIPRITFDCRQTDNGPFLHILEDFYAMQQFDCLIRPMSNYSVVAGFMKDYGVLVFPTHTQGSNCVINGVEIRFGPEES